MISDYNFEKLKNIFKNYIETEQEIKDLSRLIPAFRIIDHSVYLYTENQIEYLTEELSREKEKMMGVITIQGEGKLIDGD